MLQTHRPLPEGVVGGATADGGPCAMALTDGCVDKAFACCDTCTACPVDLEDMCASAAGAGSGGKAATPARDPAAERAQVEPCVVHARPPACGTSRLVRAHNNKVATSCCFDGSLFFSRAHNSVDGPAVPLTRTRPHPIHHYPSM